MSLKSIQRAYRKEEIPVEWLGRMARFDLAQVRRAMTSSAVESGTVKRNQPSTQVQMLIHSSVKNRGNSAPVLPNGGFLRGALPALAGNRALLGRVTVESTHTASSITFHRASDFRQIEPCHAAYPFHRDFLLAIGSLDRL